MQQNNYSRAVICSDITFSKPMKSPDKIKWMIILYIDGIVKISCLCVLFLYLNNWPWPGSKFGDVCTQSHAGCIMENASGTVSSFSTCSQSVGTSLGWKGPCSSYPVVGNKTKLQPLSLLIMKYWLLNTADRLSVHCTI